MSRRHRTAPAGCACCSTTASTRPTRRRRRARLAAVLACREPQRGLCQSRRLHRCPAAAELASCAAEAHKQQDDAATRLTEAEINLQPSPVSLVADPANPSAEDLADLFERIRRYAAVSIWDTLDMTQPAVRDQVSTTPLLGDLLQELPRLTTWQLRAASRRA